MARVLRLSYLKRQGGTEDLLIGAIIMKIGARQRLNKRALKILPLSLVANYIEVDRKLSLHFPLANLTSGMIVVAPESSDALLLKRCRRTSRVAKP